MNPDLALSLMREMLTTAAYVAGPIIVVGMVVGLLVSVFQVVTQIQEMSLTFVPKIIAIFFLLLLLGGWMLGLLMRFATELITNIPGYIS